MCVVGTGYRRESERKRFRAFGENGWITLVEDGERSSRMRHASGQDQAKSYAAASVRFAVAADTPDEIDLGDIRPGEERHHSTIPGQGEPSNAADSR